MIFACNAERRRTALREFTPQTGPAPTGIDFLDVDATGAPRLTLHLVNPIPARAKLNASMFVLEGGERISGITVLKVDPDTSATDPRRVFLLTLDRVGDLSTYRLRVLTDRWPAAQVFDPQLTTVELSFHVKCQTGDCLATPVQPAETWAEPALDYLAKDYASFRRLLLDRLSLLTPGWSERNAADLGVTLVELLAYVGDQLSYQQDAVATEAYLGTARRRVSVRRHARLIDYPMHDGCNARTWVHLDVSSDVVGTDDTPAVRKGTAFLTGVVGLPTQLAPGSADYRAAHLSTTTFESMHDLDRLLVAHNRLRFYTWGGDRCWLPVGATSATVRGTFAKDDLEGRVLILVEERGAISGELADADLTKRHAVRVTRAETGIDPLGNLFGQAGTTPTVELTELTWHEDDALPFALCLSTIDTDGAGVIEDVTVALGNNVLADHGRTVTGEHLAPVPESRFAYPDGTPAPPRYRPHLRQRPLTLVAPTRNDAEQPASAAVDVTAQIALPDLTLSDGNGLQSSPRRDLLNEGPDSRNFVAEIENDGTATIRFGDDRFGKRPSSGTTFTATYRVGNGIAGNIGAEAIGHIVDGDRAIQRVTNPLPAVGGLEPESIESVRRQAPAAFRRLERAVTPADYAELAGRHPEVQRAAATFRWTGSWRTVFLTVDRRGGLAVDERFRAELRAFLEVYRLAGHDLEIDGPRPVPLHIGLHYCADPAMRRVDVERALRDLFSNRQLADGRRGLFHPDNLAFGQSIYLSQLYAAALAVPGVTSVEILQFQRLNLPASDALATGELKIDRLEVARLDNNPNRLEFGQFDPNVDPAKETA